METLQRCTVVRQRFAAANPVDGTGKHLDVDGTD